MANKSISELTEATAVNNQDLFVLEQGGLAKKMTAETFITAQNLIDALAEALDGHGGIQTVALTNISGRIRTYTMIFSDGSATTFQVYDGTSIERIAKTSTAGLVDTYTIFMNDGTTSFFTVSNGADGDVSEATLNNALKYKAPVIAETTASSAIANFTDGADDMVMHNIVAEIDPVQDDTYGDPYPAGAGKNQFNKEALDSVADYTTWYNQYFYCDPITLKANTTYTMSPTSTSSLGVSYYYVLYSNPDASDPDYIGGGNSQFKYPVTAGTPTTVTFTTGDTGTIRFAVPVSSSAPSATALTAFMTIDYQLEEGSTATSWTPYENICPITGHTGATVTRVGKNLLKIDRTEGTATSGYVSPRDFDFDCLYAGITANNYFGSANINSYSVTSSSVTVNSSSRPYGIGYPLSVIPETTYYLSFTCSGSGEVRIGYYDANGNYLSSTGAITASGSFTPPSGAYIADIVFTCASSTIGTSLTYSSIQVEHGSTATAYEPYQSTTLAIDWTTEAGTVYGGTLDVTTGLLTVTHQKFVFSGSEDWVFASDFFYVVLMDSGINVSAFYTTENGVKLYLNGNNGHCRIYLSDNSFLTSSSDINSYLTDSIGVVYELATPQTYQLTGQQLKTLYGTNNVWADTGNVTVTYPADTKMYIDNAIAALA